MTTPPFLVLAVLLFWGWQTDHVFIGAVAGAALEASRFTRFRWSLAQADFNRLSNVCIVLFLGVGTFLLVNEGTVSLDDFFASAGKRPEALRQAGRSALTWFQWFPMIFLPLLLAQVFNDPPRMGLATFSWWVRKQEALRANATLLREAVDISFAFVALTLLAASATLERAEFFYWGLAALIGWALLAARARRHSLAVWLMMFGVVAGAGFGGHHGIIALQRKLETMNVRWFAQWAGAGFSDREMRTRLGAIGRLKNSNRIVLRLTTDGAAPPELLREMSYNLYSGGAKSWNSWRVDKRDFNSLPGETDQSTWLLLPRKASRHTLNIAGYFNGGEGLLPLPTGSSELAALPVGEVATNLFGAVKMSGGPGLAIFDVRYDDRRGPTIDSGWTTNDLKTYVEDEPSVRRVAEELQLRPGMPVAEAVRRVREFFATKFSYTSELTEAHAAARGESALGRFLLQVRTGHCEYFATATTLLLRHAGVPTRYAVGYSVQEGSGRKHIVRDRHAHAWTLVWDGQSWTDLDTTPGSWNAAEAARASWLQPVKDFFSDLWFQFSKFRWGQTEWRKWFMLAPVPLLIVVLVRFFFGKSWRQMRARRREAARLAERAGADSEFYRVEKYFATRGLARAENENWSDWLRRVGALDAAASSLDRVLALHQRHRFDPQGLGADERTALREEVSRWLKQAAR